MVDQHSFLRNVGTTDIGTFEFNGTNPNPNTAPTITSNSGGATASISVAENSTAVTTVTAADSDLPAQSLTYSLSGDDQAQFAIHPSTGVLTFASAPDFEAPTDAGGNNVFNVIVHVSDTNGGIDSQDLAITVTDINENLYLISGTIYEDVDGDGLVSDDGVGLANAIVSLYRDNGDGTMGAGDTIVNSLMANAGVSTPSLARRWGTTGSWLTRGRSSGPAGSMAVMRSTISGPSRRSVRRAV